MAKFQLTDDHITYFDVRGWLDYVGIRYWESGKNVSKGWIGVECIYCNDNHNHLGIKLSDKRFSCWKCESSGQILRLIQDIEDCTYLEAKDRILEFQDEGITTPIDTGPLRATTPGEHILPKEASDTWPKPHLKYLRERGFDPERIIPLWGLKAIHNISDLRYRILIPVHYKGEVVNWTARDVTGRGIPYLHCPNRKAYLHRNEIVYGYDHVRDVAVITEGVTDAWRIGPGAVATLGIRFGIRQVQQLLDLNCERYFVMFDSEDFAIYRAHQLAEYLSMAGRKAEVIELDEGDPGSMTQAEAEALRRDIGLI